MLLTYFNQRERVNDSVPIADESLPFPKTGAALTN